MKKDIKEILAEIESGVGVSLPKSMAGVSDAREPDLFSGIIASKDSDAADKIRELDINTVTPIEAMNFLFELKRMLSD